MRRLPWVPISLVLVIASCAALTALSWPGAPARQRLQAQRRWASRPFAHYRIAIRVDFGGNGCSQELETRGEHLRRVIYNTCRPNWIGLTTVERLFEIDAGLDRAEPCYSLAQVCSCTRVGWGDIAYDARLGYPTEIVYRREIRPNFLNADYWRRLIWYRQLPSCGPLDQRVRIAVVALIPAQ